jgi:hypothetical protein
MIRAAAPLAVLVLLGACATTPEANPGSYTLGRGQVTYDEMRRATADCQAVGGTVRPIDVGGDNTQMSNYLCAIPPKGKSQ